MKKLFLTYFLLFISFITINAQLISNDTSLILNYVSVINEFGDVELNWTYKGVDIIEGYSMNNVVNLSKNIPSHEPFFYISDINAISYTDTRGYANQKSVPYSVGTYIFSTNDTIRTHLSSAHFTIFLEAELEECSDSIYLHWNRYYGWEDSLTWYRVYENGSLLHSTQDTSYNIEVEINSNYQYVIEAIETDRKFISKSNIVEVETVFPESTDFINADYATVNDESIFLSFTLGEHGEEYEYLLLAKPPGSNTFSDSLATFNYSEQLDYNFLTGNVSEQYQFKIQEINRCGRPVKESNISSNIVLEGEKDESVVHLNWTNYFDWLADVETYTVYRDVGHGFEEIYTISGLRYQDEINAFIADKQIASINYYIEATEGSGNPYLSQPQMSSSNIITIYLESELEFPTAFTPNADGRNDVFRPIDLYFIPTDYHLVVFDRWGKKVFETKQVEEGWDGKFSSGQNVLEGVYSYHVQYKNPEGIEISQTGIVTVIYP